MGVRTGGVLGRLLSGVDPRLVSLHVLPERPAATADWPEWLAPSVVERLAGAGIERPWSHQRLAADEVRAGRHVVLATGTSSGKSMAYLLPIAQVAAERARTRARGDRPERATALYLAPTKALAHDQERAIRAFGFPGLEVATLDGDSTVAERDWARRSADLVLTNPDMLHHAVLPGHERHRRLLAGLKLVVLDECHHYRGVFGAHVTQVLRRLRRLCRHYGTDPVFVLASATVGRPAESAARLVGSSVLAITDDASPRGTLTFALVDPAATGRAGPDGGEYPPTAHGLTSDLVADLARAHSRTVAFVRSRRSAETVAQEARSRLANSGDPDDDALTERVRAYRGGLLPEERRALEASLTSGELLAVASTNALELGIDIAGLDAVVLSGFPGTRASLWQQVGRAGRRGREALAVLVAGADPLDAYLVRHPELLFDREPETSAFDPDNPHVVAPHLAAAAAELPIRPDELAVFGPAARGLVEELTAVGLLRERPTGWFWTRRQRASDLADIRGAGAPALAIVEADTGRMLGTVDAAASHLAVHEGAVYLHQGETYLVRMLDEAAGVAMCDPVTPDYSTTARSVTAIDVVTEQRRVEWGAATVSFGDVVITSQVVGYLRRRVGTGELLGEVELDLPERQLGTTATWWTLRPEAVAAAGIEPGALAGAAHAAEHAAIGLLPLVTACDRWDIGGFSTACHHDTGTVTVFVHDGYPGGAGIAEQGFSHAATWLRATRDAVAACPCTDGCPSCVQSPKCGNANNPLDKAAAVRLLDAVLLGAPHGDGGAARRG